MTSVTVFEYLKKKNEYPIIFVGSGISRRYLNGFPGWIELLKLLWNKCDNNQDFFSFLNILRREIREEKPGINDEMLGYLLNIRAGSRIQMTFDAKFYSGELEVNGFSQEDAFYSEISPFKKEMANIFGSYTIKDDSKKEYELFKRFLHKAQIILTTNYDTFIEDSFNSIIQGKIKTYVGHRGFFENSFGWAELFKLHGCVSKPESIVIAEDDYNKFDENSILISARIITMLVNSPIIFIGYSLTDMNIRKIIRDFSSSINPGDIENIGSRIIIIEREEGLQEIRESSMYDKELGCHYTLLRTDNYAALYELLIEINQGVSPVEVRKFQGVIRELIVDRGRKGSLNTLLISPGELDDIASRVGDEKLVVALGDTTYIFAIPDFMTYIYDYMFDTKELHTDIAFRFVSSQNPTSRIPFYKHLIDTDLDKTNLKPEEKERIRQRINRNSNVKSVTSSIIGSNRIPASSLMEIINMNHRLEKEMDIICFNINKFNIDEVEEYLKEKVMDYKSSGITTMPTSMRRLLLAYDIKKYKEV